MRHPNVSRYDHAAGGVIKAVKTAQARKDKLKVTGALAYWANRVTRAVREIQIGRSGSVRQDRRRAKMGLIR